MEERILKITFNKSGGTASKNGVTTRVTLPTAWVRELGLSQDNREIKAIFKDNKIMIEPNNK